MPTVKLAKRSAFVATVRELHLAGELTDELKPKAFSVETVDFKWLFPHYRKEESKARGEAGTKRRRQIYDVKVLMIWFLCETTFFSIVIFSFLLSEYVPTRESLEAENGVLLIFDFLKW